jgi:hypothetical protein
VAWLSTLHLALGGDDGNSATPVAWRVQGKEVFVGVPEGSELHARFPGGGFAVVLPENTAPVVVRGDGRLFTDGRPRGLPFLCVESEPSSSFGLELSGRLVRGAPPLPSPLPLPALRASGENGAAREVRRLAEMLPWLLNNALVHYLSPRGLEQYSGGGWGTRDACQGPLEMLLALDCPEAARDLVLRVFAAQNADGDWPQWFQFIERERDLRASDSHGDIVFWPLLALARTVLGTSDGSLRRCPSMADAAPARHRRRCCSTWSAPSTSSRGAGWPAPRWRRTATATGTTLYSPPTRPCARGCAAPGP